MKVFRTGILAQVNFRPFFKRRQVSVAPVDRDIISFRNSCTSAFRQRPVHCTFVVLSSRHNKLQCLLSAPGTGKSEALIIAPLDICFPKLHTERGGRRKEKRRGVEAPTRKRERH